MKTLALLTALAVAAAVVPLVNADHDAGCVPSQADPSTINEINTPDGRTFYLEERDNPLGTSPPVPGSGFVLGGGTWLYEETNGVGGMQRGGIGITGACFPPEPAPCVLIDQDPIEDEHCGHGFDQIIF